MPVDSVTRVGGNLWPVNSVGMLPKENASLRPHDVDLMADPMQPLGHGVSIAPLGQPVPATSFMPESHRTLVELRKSEVEREAPLVHRLVRSYNTTQIRKLLREHPELIRATNENGETPLHVAAIRGAVLVAEVLDEFDPDMYANDRSGLTPAYAAALNGHPVTSRFLIERTIAEPPKNESRWKTAAEVDTRLQAFVAEHPSPTADQISEVVAELLGIDVDDLNDSVQLVKNATHLESLDGKVVGVDAEGWWSASFFAQRIRALVTALVQDDIPQSPQRSQNRAAFVREVSTLLEATRLARRMVCVQACKNPDVTAAATDLEARNVTRWVADLPAGEEISIPGGFPGHAIYIGLQRHEAVLGTGDSAETVPCIMVRVDNLGAGVTEAHEREPGSGRVMSRSFNVPLGFLSSPEGATAFRAFVQGLLACKVGPGTDQSDFYGHVATLKRSLKNQYPEDLVEDRSQVLDTDAQAPQRVGNCSVENTHRGLEVRLGDRQVYEWFRRYEKKLASNVLSKYVQMDAIMAKARRERDETDLHELIVAGGPHLAQRLADFFRDPLEGATRGDLAGTVTAVHLRKVIAARDVESLRILLAHGAPAEAQGPSDETPLHWAAKVGSAPMVKLLLEYVEHVDDPDADGCTPLFRAAQRAKGEIIEMLRARGADKDRANEKGVTPADVVGRHKAAATRAFDLMVGETAARGGLAA